MKRTIANPTANKKTVTRTLVEVAGVEIHGPAAKLDKLLGLFGDLSPRFYVTEFGFRS